jgi:Asp-tRNA(Asn)/Glu-tRNA(Gln) amidotransferase A subunit family amidase
MSGKKIKESFSQNIRKIENQRIGVAKNFHSTAEVKKILSYAIENLKSLGVTTDVEVPFESATFSIQKIDQDRRNISKTLFKDIDILLLPTVADTTPTLNEVEKSGPNAVATENTFFL